MSITAQAINENNDAIIDLICRNIPKVTPKLGVSLGVNNLFLHRTYFLSFCAHCLYIKMFKNQETIN